MRSHLRRSRPLRTLMRTAESSQNVTQVGAQWRVTRGTPANDSVAPRGGQASYAQATRADESLGLGCIGGRTGWEASFRKRGTRKQVMTQRSDCVDSWAMQSSWSERARRLQSETLTVYLVARHPHTPWYAKLLAACVAAYALSPIDIIPDPIPVLGLVDDLLLVPLGLALVLRMIPEEVLTECRAKARAIAHAPTSWAGAVIVMSVWLVLTVLAVAFILRLFRG